MGVLSASFLLRCPPVCGAFFRLGLHIAFLVQKSCEGTKTTKQSVVGSGRQILLLKVLKEGQNVGLKVFY